MDFVCDLLLTIGSEYNLAVDSPHHVHKGFMTPGDADSGRGSTGIRDAGRLVYTLVPMSSEEAQMLGIDETRRKLYVRLDPAKINITVHAAGAAWFQLHGQPIGNGTDRPRCRPIRRCSPQSALWSMAKAQSTQRPTTRRTSRNT
jgi:hypothetical protein